MDKKVCIIIGIAVVMVALVIGLFAISSGEMKVNKDVLMTIDGEEYKIDDFRKYMRIKNEIDGDIAKTLEAEDMDKMIQSYLESKIYAKAADTKGITVPDEEVEKFKTTYTEKTGIFAPYEISEEDYLKYSVDDYKYTEISNNFSNYYELSDELYNQALEGISGDKITYGFRVMTFNYEKETSGDAATSGDVAQETLSGDEEDRTRETVLVKAQTALDKVKSGDDFEEVAKEFGTYRFTFKGVNYTLVNGELEYATAPVLESKINNKDLYNALLTLNSGDTTQLVEDEENSYIYFARLESVEDGFVGEGEKELKEIILNELQDSLVAQGMEYNVNQSALVRAFYKQ